MNRWIAVGLLLFALWLASLHTHKIAELTSTLGPVTPQTSPAISTEVLPAAATEASLLQSALNRELPQDDRFEAVYHMTLNPQAQQELEKLAATPLPKMLSATSLEFEKILRAYAIEGLTHVSDSAHLTPFLRHLQTKTEDQFLNQRIQTALASLADGESMEQKDQVALKKLLQAARN